MPDSAREGIIVSGTEAAERSAYTEGIYSQLDNIAESLFVHEHEEHIIRPLCKRLGYLLTVDVNILDVSWTAGNLVQFEGIAGGVELLHPCAVSGEDSSHKRPKVVTIQK